MYPYNQWGSGMHFLVDPPKVCPLIRLGCLKSKVLLRGARTLENKKGGGGGGSR